MAPVLATAAAIPATVVNVQEFKRRIWNSAYFGVELTSPRWRTLNLSAVLVLGALATGLALVLDPPITRLVGDGTAGRVLAAAIGLCLGLSGLGFVGLGAAVHTLFWSPGPEFSLFWTAPIVGGVAVRFVHVDEFHRHSAWRFALDLTRRGTVIAGPTRADPFWRVAGLLAGTAPLVGLLVVSPPDTAPDRYACYGGAALVILHSAWADRRSREIPHRWHRLPRVASGAAARVLVTVAAAGPAGALCADLWARAPVLTGLGGGLIVAAVVTALWAVPVALARRDRRLPGRVNLAASLVRLPFTGGLLPLTVAIFHPRAGLPVAALVIVAAETASLLAGRDRSVIDALTAAGGLLFIDVSVNRNGRLAGRWLQDAVVSRPARPEYALIRALNARAARAARGVTGGDRARPPRTGPAAACWNDLAGRLLDLVDEEVVPRHPAKHRARLSAAQDVARADTAWSRAVAATHVRAWADAERHWRDAAARHMVLGHPNHELFARVMVVLLLALHLDRPAETERQAARLARSTAGPPVLRSCVALARAAAASARGDTRAAAATLDGLSPVTPRAFRAAWADDPHPDRLERWSPDECARVIAACEAQLRASIAEKGAPEEARDRQDQRDRKASARGAEA
ncbi:hypothetical protein [Actinomadura chibensis]|uniref:Uncharacterized protein n=1 Tax=Actinomadura chibensis TaxID=392828 RepID=A0A5D0NLX9_9ACTN|nr:hypothetical protein [Actinomadura chibensis]TYB45520.1 hypothetical protein FXF69_19000 [Actinomadura chibensis]